MLTKEKKLSENANLGTTSMSHSMSVTSIILSFFENRTSMDQKCLFKGICRKERGVSYPQKDGRRSSKFTVILPEHYLTIVTVKSGRNH